MEGLGCLMIDLQDCFLKAMPGRENLTNRAAFVIEACGLLEIPIYFSEQVPEKLGPTLPELKDRSKGSYAFGKNAFSAWDEPEFQTRLQQDKINHLLVAGIETTICVYQTVIAARNAEMPVTLLSDAIACRRPEDAPAVIRTLQDHQTLFLPSETIFYSILQNVKHPVFREFTKLVKHYSA